MEKYTSNKVLEAIDLSRDELECLIRAGKDLSAESVSNEGELDLDLVFIEDGGYYKVGNYWKQYSTDDKVLIKPILLPKEKDGMKKNSGWIANLRKLYCKKFCLPEDVEKYLSSNLGVDGYPSNIEGEFAQDINESFHRGHLMAREIICKFINPRIQVKKHHKKLLVSRKNHRQKTSRDIVGRRKISRIWCKKYPMIVSNRQRHNIYTQFKQSNCAKTDDSTRKGQGYFEKKIVDYLESKKGEKGHVNYEVRALFKNASDKVPRANLLCARFYDSCGLLDEQETFCVVIPNMGSLGRDYSSIASYKFSYEDGLIEAGKGN